MMNNLRFTLLGAAALISLAGCADGRPTSLPPGEYTSTQKSTNTAGTETERTTRTNVYYDEYGNKRAVEETETSRDPEGWFNKSTSTRVKTYN
jgi:hypothetical protein